MGKYINFIEIASKKIQNEPFLVYFFPMITLLSCGILFYYGFQGIIKRKTISLFHFRGVPFNFTNLRYEGKNAQIVGVIQIIIGLFLLLFLGGISYKIVFY